MAELQDGLHYHMGAVNDSEKSKWHPKEMFQSATQGQATSGKQSGPSELPHSDGSPGCIQQGDISTAKGPPYEK